ncbi:MAG: RNA polymerase sigma-70 factor [Tannerella sp.]|jgi:RNA polymerase sigma-70 factor (ECF subfamily)|nr:RNA polymerase sigma-70 factor [Tannerella sp.]
MNSKVVDHYREVYVKYAPALLRFAEKFVSQFYAEDVVHDVFLKLWDRQIFLLPDNEVRRILYVSVKNACIDHVRKLKQEQEYIDTRIIQLKLDELDFYEASDELFMREDLLRALLQKIEKLPERSREIFKMSYLEGLKAAEIAEKLNISTRTVENLLYRSLLFLRKNAPRYFIYLFIFIR